MKFNYENKQYLEMLKNVDFDFYSKYVTYVKKYLKSKNRSFLDIGCGNGNALVPLVKSGYNNVYGGEISKLLSTSAQKRGLKNIFQYDGEKLPFDSNCFDVVGSFGVLEHAENPTEFLKEHVRTVKKGGYVVVTCPNFLTVFFRLEHPRADKLFKRLKNIPKIVKKIFSNEISFEKIAPIIRKKFQADDDVITISNLIDMERFFERNNCRIISSNGFMFRNNEFLRVIGSIPFLRYFWPSCFLVAQKK